jgi:hypothetical protein
MIALSVLYRINFRLYFQSSLTGIDDPVMNAVFKEFARFKSSITDHP